ncbi:MAG TPA: MFS transporter [Candidatus Limnocylindrales bacterium]
MTQPATPSLEFILLLGVVYILLCTGVYGLGFWLPTVIKAFGVSNMTTGLLTMIPYVAAILGLLFTAWAVKRYKGNYLPLAIAFGGSAFGMFMSTVFAEPTLQLVFLSLCAFFIFPTTSTFWPIPSSIVVGATAAAGIAAINSIGNLGGFVGPYIVGAIADATGSTRYGMVFLAACLALACLLVWVVKATLGKPATRRDADVQAVEGVS